MSMVKTRVKKSWIYEREVGLTLKADAIIKVVDEDCR